MVKFEVLKNKREVARKGAEFVAKQIMGKKDSVLGLATGKTMEGFYRELVEGGGDFKEVKTFNLDEYIGLSSGDKKSYRYYMDKKFFGKIKIKRMNINFLNGDAEDLGRECKGYEELLKSSGGMDLQILGIGRNGHIGFNEPGSKVGSRTREVDLTLGTRKANAGDFGGFVGLVPRRALTMGVGTILEAKKIVLVAFGVEKAKAVRDTLEGEISEKVPASFLRKHKDVVFVLDEKAAGKLKRR